MLDKLQGIETRYLHLQEQVMEPDVMSDMSRYIAINKEISSLQEVYDLVISYKKCRAQIDEAKEILANETDAEMIEMAEAELEEAEAQIPDLEQRIKIALLPKDPNDDKDVYLEIRPAAGGDEAGLFATQLLKMYLAYALKKGRKTEIIDEQLSDI
jgi:peptide chain release factor 1